MALQGDLHSFALADVLRLLAGTAKTGRLDVAGDAGNGEVWFDQGDLVGGEVTTSPHASRSADVVFEMLRFENGTFRFDEGDVPPDTVERTDVDDALGAAQVLVGRWESVEAVIASVHSWLTLAEQLEADDVIIAADQWRLVAAVASGTTTRTLGDRFELTDLETSELVKDLVELGIVEVGDVVAPPEEALFEAPATGVDDLESDDLVHLSAEDGPVVLESRDDALLPEPLPGEGTSFVGELDALGSVDGRTYESYGAVEEAADLPEAPPFELDSYQVEPDETSHEAPAADLGSFGADAFEADLEEPADDATPSWSSYGSLEGMADETDEPDEVHEVEADEPTGGYAMPAETLAEFEGASDDEVEPSGEDDRGSLLKFLSSVKP